MGTQIYVIVSDTFNGLDTFTEVVGRTFSDPEVAELFCITHNDENYVHDNSPYYRVAPALLDADFIGMTFTADST